MEVLKDSSPQVNESCVCDWSNAIVTNVWKQCRRKKKKDKIKTST